MESRGGRLRLNAPELNNHGILLGGVLAIDSKTLNNHGSILQLGLGKLNIKTARLRNDHGAKILDNLGKPDGATTSTLQMPVSSASHEDGYINVSGKLSNYGKLLAMGAINLEVSDEYEKATTGTVNVSKITAPPPKIIPLPTPTYSSSSYGYGGTPWRSPYKNYDDDHGGKYSSMEPQESNYRPPAPKPPKAADLEAEAINRKYTSMEPQERNKPQNTVASAVQLNRGDGVNKSFNDMRLPPYTGPFGWEESFGGGGPSHEMQQLASREIAAYQSGEKKIMTEEELKEELRRISLPPSKFERTTNFIGNVWHETVEFVNPYTPFIELYQSVKAGDVKEAVIATASIIPPVGKLKKSKKFYKIVEKGEDAGKVHPDLNIGKNRANHNPDIHKTVSDRTHKPHRSPDPLDNPNAVQVPTGRFPQYGQKPNTILYRADNDNTITSYAVYDKYGMITKRVDMKGNSHILKGNPPQEITTPHVHEYGRNHNAPGGVQVRRPDPTKDIRKARPDELQYYKPKPQPPISTTEFPKFNIRNDFKFSFKPDSRF